MLLVPMACTSRQEVYPHESPAIFSVVFGVKTDRKIRIRFLRFQRLRELLDCFALVNLFLHVGVQIIVDAISRSEGLNVKESFDYCRGVMSISIGCFT